LRRGFENEDMNAFRVRRDDGTARESRNMTQFLAELVGAEEDD
jgi:hypothetical protein